MHVIQIDSVNVLARAHEMPLWSRLGPYRRGTLGAMLDDAELVEYWAHEASLVPSRDWPLFEPRRRNARDRMWPGVRDLGERKPEYIASVLAEVQARGSVAASDLKEPARRTGPWWDWHDAKLALEWLFWCGEVTARRRPNFEREYMLPESHVPAEFLAAPPFSDHDARVEMLDRAGQVLGVATYADLCDYYQLRPKESRAGLETLVEQGRVRPVRVEGWREVAYVHIDAPSPRPVSAALLVSPFDPAVRRRDRALRLFDFHYRIEIYTPAARRVHGYYVLPFLFGERFAARVDLRADRRRRILEVLGCFAEPHADKQTTAEALGTELTALAAWLDLDAVEVARHGDLASALRRTLH